MTCIIGYADKGKVYIGGDSASISGSELRYRKDKKVFIKGDFIFGFTTSFRMGQILQYSFNPPLQKDNESDDCYMYTTFINSIINTFAECNYGSKSSGGDFLVGWKGHLYRIQEDYQIEEVFEPYNAIGCGSDLALGSLHTTYAMDDMTISIKMHVALSAAAAYSTGVVAPFIVLSV